MLAPSKHLKFVSITTDQCPNIFLTQTISEKNPKNRFEDIKLTEGGSYNM